MELKLRKPDERWESYRPAVPPPPELKEPDDTPRDPDNWDSYPLQGFHDATRSLGSGLLAFFLGLMWGTIILLPVNSPDALKEWPMLLLIAIFGVLYNLYAHWVWGLVQLITLVVFFYGLIWREWNRVIGMTSVALISTAVTWATAEDRSLDFSRESLITLGLVLLTAVVLALAVAWERRQTCAPEPLFPKREPNAAPAEPEEPGNEV